MMAEPNDILVAVTGASGTIYADRLLRALTSCGGAGGPYPHSRGRGNRGPGSRVGGGLRHPAGFGDGRSMSAPAFACISPMTSTTAMRAAPPRPEAMIIVPCTIGTVGHLAAGLNNNLVHRAAGVMLKEQPPPGVGRSRVAAQPGRPAQPCHPLGSRRHHHARRALLLLPAHQPRRDGRLLRRARARSGRVAHRACRPLGRLATPSRFVLVPSWFGARRRISDLPILP